MTVETLLQRAREAMAEDDMEPCDRTLIGDLVAKVEALKVAAEAGEFMLATLCVDRETETRRMLRAAVA